MKKEKIETNEEFILRKAKETKEIEKLEKEKAKPKLAGYLLYFVFIITIVYFVDEITTNVGTQMGTLIANAFFASGDGKSNTIKIIADGIIMFAAGIAMIMRPLSDRYGRKIFLVIYTLGMGVGLFLICIATKWPAWFIGSFMIQFCIPHDMQAIYIQECAPQKHRGTYYSVIKGLASFGVLLIPVLRKAFSVDTAINGWRNVYFILACIGIGVAILAFIFMRESDVYIDNRLYQLRMSEEDRKALKEKENQDNQKYGIIQGFKHVFKRKQLFWIGISFGFVFFAYQLTTGYDSIAKNFWGLANIENFDILMFDSESVLYNEDVFNRGEAYYSTVLTLWGLGCALVQLFPGFIADKIGRKKATIFFGVGTLVSYILFYIGAVNLWNPYLIGFLIGWSCGSVWAFGDLLLLMTSESVETNLRVSVNTAIYIFAGTFRGISMGVFAIFGGIFGDMYIAPITLAMSVFGLALGTFFLFTKVKDTKDIDMDTVKASDFE